MKKIRAFVAVDPAPEVARKIGEFIRAMERETRGMRWVGSHGIHVTLRFLGALEEDTLDEVKKRLTQLGELGGPIELQAAGIGFFPKPERPRVVWIGLNGEVDRLVMVQQKVTASIADLPLAKEEGHEFQPHLTVARIADTWHVRGLNRLTAAQATDFGRFSVAELHLYKSDLTPTGSTYTKLASFPLTAKK